MLAERTDAGLVSKGVYRNKVARVGIDFDGLDYKFGSIAVIDHLLKRFGKIVSQADVARENGLEQTNGFLSVVTNASRYLIDKGSPFRIYNIAATGLCFMSEEWPEDEWRLHPAFRKRNKPLRKEVRPLANYFSELKRVSELSVRLRARPQEVGFIFLACENYPGYLKREVLGRALWNEEETRVVQNNIDNLASRISKKVRETQPIEGYHYRVKNKRYKGLKVKWWKED